MNKVSALEQATKKWWFFLALFFIQLVPPITTKPLDPSATYAVIAAILSNSIMTSLRPFWPIFQVLPLIVIILLVTLRNRAAKLFSLYAGISYVIFALLQNIAVNQEFGTGFVTTNIIMFLGVAAFWFWESRLGMNDFRRLRPPALRWLVVPPAVLAFWMPIDWQTRSPLFDPMLIFTSGSGLTFCMMTPVYLAMLELAYPRVNIPLLRITSLVGTIIGFYNMLLNFVFIPSFWWNGILHLPLVALSIYGIVLGYRKTGEP